MPTPRYAPADQNHDSEDLALRAYLRRRDQVRIMQDQLHEQLEMYSTEAALLDRLIAAFPERAAENETDGN